ncbi:MAG: NPCBM/NEW2 domain-containing protein [Clostridia bacterium]|nr:NPCBM/NEW2 domain-containing protein [Clostridia bacterium]
MKKRMCAIIKRLLAVMLAAATLLAVPTVRLQAANEEENTKMEARKTPLMGWASWNAYRTNISEETILAQAELLVSLGLRDLGYTYVNTDDGWQNGRGEDGLVKTNLQRFPSGMKALADAIHAMGLKAGIYTDAGASTCGWQSDGEVNNDNVGLYGYDEADLNRYLVEWGYDFIKVDWCGGVRLGLDQKERYTAIGRIIADIEKKTQTDKIYNVCSWGFPGEWVVDCADSWRTGGDISSNFDSVLYQIDNIKSLAKYNGPGHINDLDMMQIGNGMTYEEDKSHFAMWCMMSTPLMLGMDLSSISEETLSIVSNRELIAINQDPACIQATVAATYGSVEAWTKDLGTSGSGRKAIALLNRRNEEVTLTVSFEELGLGGVSTVRDLWSHEDVATGDSYTVTLPAHGTAMLVAEGTPIVSENVDITLPDGSDPTASMTVAAKSATVNLSKLGTYDWRHFAKINTAKQSSPAEITLSYEGSYTAYDNAAARYRWTDAAGDTPSGASTSGIGVIGVGAYMLLSTPCDGNLRTLTVAIGSYSADMLVELIVGGKVIDTVELRGAADRKVDRLLTVSYSSDKPTTAYLRWTVTKKHGTSESVNIEGAALRIQAKANTLSAISVDQNATPGRLSASVRLTAVEDACLHWVLKSPSGKLHTVQSEAVTASEGVITKTLLTELPTDFEGELQAYLWNKADLPLAQSVKAAVRPAFGASRTVGPMTAKGLLAKGAMLLDVRSAAEYATEHLTGAVNLDYTEIASGIEALIPDKTQPLLVYCSSAKRSAQAVKTLTRLGYTAVYHLGSMANLSAEPMITFSSDTCKVITAGERVGVSFTASPYDTPTVYLSAGKQSTFKDSVPMQEFRVPDVDAYYLTLKAYLVQDGICYAETEKEFIFWSDKTVDVYATALDWSEATIGWGSIRTDRSVEGNPLRLAGKTFSHGIGTHATSRITMAIPDGAKKFLAVAEGDLEKSGEETMMFYVYIDGKEVDHSSLIRIGQHYVFDIDIPEDAQTITLYAYEGTFGGNTNDHADWCVAGFFKTVTSQ